MNVVRQCGRKSLNSSEKNEKQMKHKKRSNETITNYHLRFCGMYEYVYLILNINCNKYAKKNSNMKWVRIPQPQPQISHAAHKYRKPFKSNGN